MITAVAVVRAAMHIPSPPCIQLLTRSRASGELLIAGTGNADYLEKVQAALQQAFKESKPDIILYNAGKQRDALCSRRHLRHNSLLQESHLA